MTPARDRLRCEFVERPLPDGPGGRALLVFDNFRATMKWNKSVKFAASVGMIADGIERG